MISRILVVADATIEAVETTSEALKTIHSGELHIKVLFISRLSGVSLRNLGYNILTLLMREEQEALQRARIYFTMNRIPYDIRVITGSDRQAVSKEIEDQAHDILILQGVFANIWRKDHPSHYGLGGITGSPNPVWILNDPENPPQSLSGLRT
jgi:hypothetical protein